MEDHRVVMKAQRLNVSDEMAVVIRRYNPREKGLTRNELRPNNMSVIAPSEQVKPTRMSTLMTLIIFFIPISSISISISISTTSVPDRFYISRR